VWVPVAESHTTNLPRSGTPRNLTGARVNAPELVPLWWEIGKAVGFVVFTGYMERLRRLLVDLRDGHRDLKREVSGSDGKNGLKSEMRAVKEKMGELEDWLLVVDSVLKMRGMYDAPHEHAGEERRREVARRLRGIRKEGT
jgi:hypothetical protein